MAYTPRPHVSAALQHLRFSIVLASVALGAALVAQVLIWSLVHFTDVRIARLEPHEQRTSFEVVESAAGKTDQTPVLREREVVPADVNAVPSAQDVTLRRASGIVQTVGVLSACLLCILLLQGVVIAGGANVPGVELAVTATTWGLIVCGLSLPVAEVIPGTIYPGVFASYESIVQTSMQVRDGAPGAPGDLSFYGMHLMLPIVLLLGLIACVLRFRAGIEHGVIVTNASQLDEKVEREIRSMKMGQLASPRAVGALNQAIGESDEPPAPSRPLSSPTPGQRESRPI